MADRSLSRSSIVAGTFRAPTAAMVAIIPLMLATHAAAHPSSGIVVDHAGDVYFSDLSRGLIKIDRSGNRTTIHREGFHWIALDARGVFADMDFANRMPSWLKRRTAKGGVPAILTASDSPVAVGEDGSLYYVCDDARLNPGTLQIARLAPGNKRTLINPDLRRMGARLGGIRDLAAGPGGWLYVSYAKAVLKISSDGKISRVLDPLALEDCERTPPTVSDAPALRGLAVDARGTVYIVASGSRRVLSIAPGGKIGIAMRSEAPWSPSGVAVHDGSIYVLEHVNGNSERHESWRPRVRKLEPNGSIETLVEFGE